MLACSKNITLTKENDILTKLTAKWRLHVKAECDGKESLPGYAEYVYWQNENRIL